MKFDVVATNPPFQKRDSRGRTPHKVWIEFTTATFERFLEPDGTLIQVSPASFASPSNKVLALMQAHDVEVINFDIAEHFTGVNSTFAYYVITNGPNGGSTRVTLDGETFEFQLDERTRWLPNDLCADSLEIHRKVMWGPEARLDVRHDYVTCHNIRLADTLSKTETAEHRYPVFHTNAQTWYSSVEQDWAREPKVMWTRSGYSRPFADHGSIGGTDMVYYVLTPSPADADRLAANLNTELVRYILRTARWSGFGNEIVFASLPELPTDVELSDDEMYARFDITDSEVTHVRNTLG